MKPHSYTRCLLAMAIALTTQSTLAEEARGVPATLAGHIVLPAQTFVQPPEDAPRSLSISGKYTAANGQRVDEPEQLAGHSYLSDKAVPRPTGVSLPFKGQPVQGFSGIKYQADGTAWITQDNGFGTAQNSPDAQLMVHQVKLDWQAGHLERLQTLFLSDPQKKVPFRIVNEGTDSRYLTGADFDVESIQVLGDSLWFGDELGPYLIQTDLKGQVLAVFETQLEGQTLKSPDHYRVSTPATSGPFQTRARRSRGYEGMASSPDGRFLYPFLEGPLWDAEHSQWEQENAQEYLRILEFDVQNTRWTGRYWKYPLAVKGNNIGDFNMIDAHNALVIERDNGEGLPEHACAEPIKPDCQNIPAQFKRVYRINLQDIPSGGVVRKQAYVDLLNIQDPKHLAKQGHQNGLLRFPFVTIEDVDVVDAQHIVVGNDNNLPYSAARQPNLQDDNELILLFVPELLKP